jgi:hypothetical protein
VLLLEKREKKKSLPLLIRSYLATCDICVAPAGPSCQKNNFFGKERKEKSLRRV